MVLDFSSPLDSGAFDAPAPGSALPVMLLRRGPVPHRALSLLHTDARIGVFPVADLTQETMMLGRRLSGLILATTGDPFDLLVYAASASPRIPIIMSIARRYAVDRQDILSAGASACFTLPLQRRDLDRLVPVLRSRAISAAVDTRSGLLLDAITRHVRFQNRTVELTPRQFAVLHHLLSAHGTPVSANELLTAVWNDRTADASRRRNVEVYVFHLRRKLEELGLNRPIRTVRGYGYVLTQDVTATELAGDADAVTV